MLPWAHPNLNPKRHLDRFSRFAQLTAESCYTSQWSAPFPLKISPSHGRSGHPSYTVMVPWAHPSPQPKRHLDWFSHVCTGDLRVSLYFTMVCPFPLQNCPFPLRIWTPCNAWFIRPTPVLNPNGNSIASAVFARLTSVTD